MRWPIKKPIKKILSPSLWRDASGRVCRAFWLSAVVLLAGISVMGCSKEPDPVLVTKAEAQTLEQAFAEIQALIAAGDRDGFMALVRGSDTERKVYEAVFDVAVETKRLRQLMERRHGESAMVFEDDGRSIDVLPGLSRVVTTDFSSLVAIDGGYPVQTSLWQHDLMLYKEDDRWWIDASAGSRGADMGDREQGLMIVISEMGFYREAVNRAVTRFSREGIERDEVLSDLLDEVGLATIRAMRAYREQRRGPSSP